MGSGSSKRPTDSNASGEPYKPTKREAAFYMLQQVAGKTAWENLGKVAEQPNEKYVTYANNGDRYFGQVDGNG